MNKGRTADYYTIQPRRYLLGVEFKKNYSDVMLTNQNLISGIRLHKITKRQSVKDYLKAFACCAFLLYFLLVFRHAETCQAKSRLISY